MVSDIINQTIVLYVMVIRRQRCINILTMIQARKEMSK